MFVHYSSSANVYFVPEFGALEKELGDMVRENDLFPIPTFCIILFLLSFIKIYNGNRFSRCTERTSLNSNIVKDLFSPPLY